ncbi:hypothetical protein OF846_005257 [Rhodotorula toruloides]|nr:hypothetical protein OF846_005257 [Rhodotorula toruloides]
MAATQATAKGTHGQVRTAADLQQGASIRLYRVSGGAENAIECIKTTPEVRRHRRMTMAGRSRTTCRLSTSSSIRRCLSRVLRLQQDPDPFTTTSNYAVQPAAPEWMHNGRYAQAPRTDRPAEDDSSTSPTSSQEVRRRWPRERERDERST